MDIICTIRCSCSRGHLSDNGLSPYVLIHHIHLFPQIPSADHWQDVLAGGVLGTVLAYLSYRQYYPSLVSKNSHRPYSPRIKREVLPTHNLHTLGENRDGGNHISYNDHDDASAGTVPRPDAGHLENTWTEGDDANEVDVQPYKDSLPLESKVSTSNDAPDHSNL